MKVLWLTFIPSPYRCNFFKELGKKCELTVLFERATSSIRGNTWNDFFFEGFCGQILPGITIGGYDRFCPGIIKYLVDKNYDIIVISNPTSPTGIFASTVLRMLHIPYVVESDGAFPVGTSFSWKNKIKRYVMSPAEICFSTAELHDAYYMECGVKKENIRRYPFTSIYQSDIIKYPVSVEEKQELRAQLGMTEELIILGVGQLVNRKGYDVLINACSKLNQKKSIGCYIVGGEPPQEYIDLISQLELENIHLVSFKKKNELRKYYKASDVFVHPTREDIWGLVINEAMMNGLPVITTEKCIAGLEMVDEKNGFIIPVDDVEALTEKLEITLSDHILRGKCSTESLKIVSGFTFEKMVNVHMEVFQEILERRKQ